MLHLEDTADSLGGGGMSVIEHFSVYSVLVINWSKSSLMLLDADPDSREQTVHRVPVTSSFKYLGVQVTPEPQDFISLNLSPLINRIQDRAKVWSRLKMSLAGRVNLIKMVFMPQLCICCIIPLWWFLLKCSESLTLSSGLLYGLTSPHGSNCTNYRSPRRLGA